MSYRLAFQTRQRQEQQRDEADMVRALRLSDSSQELPLSGHSPHRGQQRVQKENGARREGTSGGKGILSCCFPPAAALLLLDKEIRRLRIAALSLSDWAWG